MYTMHAHVAHDEKHNTHRAATVLKFRCHAAGIADDEAVRNYFRRRD